jgi:hypothetical protein
MLKAEAVRGIFLVLLHDDDKDNDKNDDIFVSMNYHKEQQL